MDLTVVGKWLVVLGLGIILVGVLFWVGGRFGIPIGRLPGDISVHKDKFFLYFPLMTSLILSVFFTIIVSLILWFVKK